MLRIVGWHFSICEYDPPCGKLHPPEKDGNSDNDDDDDDDKIKITGLALELAKENSRPRKVLNLGCGP